MKLTFKTIFGYTEKEVPVLLNFGTLEPLCKDLGIEFYELDEYTKNHTFDFMSALLWHGYISACKERYQKPKYTLSQSLIWYARISKESEKELKDLLTDLSGSIVKMAKPAKGVKKKVN